MAKAQKVGDGEWAYRGGHIVHSPIPSRYIGDWLWSICGVSGRAFGRRAAKEEIDSILARAKAILDNEERSPVHGKG